MHREYEHRNNLQSCANFRRSPGCQSFDSLKSIIAFHSAEFRFGLLPFPGKPLSGQGLGNESVFRPGNFSGRSLGMISPLSGGTNLHYERQKKSSECRYVRSKQPTTERFARSPHRMRNRIYDSSFWGEKFASSFHRSSTVGCDDRGMTVGCGLFFRALFSCGLGSRNASQF